MSREPMRNVLYCSVDSRWPIRATRVPAGNPTEAVDVDLLDSGNVTGVEGGRDIN